MGTGRAHDDGWDPREIEEIPFKDRNRSRSKTTRRKGAKCKPANAAVNDVHAGWRLSPFRVLLYLAFSVLSLQATRNSHQFATVVGTISAWNFGEWAAGVRLAGWLEKGGAATGSGNGPRLVAFGAVVLVLLWVGSGLFYKMTGEGRVIGLGEEPVFFAHAAGGLPVSPVCPTGSSRSITATRRCSSIITGPSKVYTDPRLEVAGADLFKNYVELGSLMRKDVPGWETQLNDIGRPVIMVDHEYNWDIGATLFRSAHCAVSGSIPLSPFLCTTRAQPSSELMPSTSRRGHFRPDPSADSRTLAELKATAKAFRSYVPAVAPPGGEQARPFYWLGLDDARRIQHQVPDSPDAWKLMGQIELFRAFPRETPVARDFVLRLMRFSIYRWSERLMPFAAPRSSCPVTFRRFFPCGSPMILA